MNIALTSMENTIATTNAVHPAQILTQIENFSAHPSS